MGKKLALAALTRSGAGVEACNARGLLVPSIDLALSAPISVALCNSSEAEMPDAHAFNNAGITADL